MKRDAFWHRRRASILLGATTVLTALLAASGASAETVLASAGTAAPVSTRSQASGNRTEAAQLGDIVVTATRTAQSIQRVPISMEALGTEKLTERQVASFADYVNLLPSVSFSSLGPDRSNPFRDYALSSADFG